VIEERIKAVGYGETQPVSSDPARNRRVELYITPITKG
jgi:outer membrane protein OmpA-like peptidoglycan-associated protein